MAETKIDKFQEFCGTRNLYFPSAEIYANTFAGFYEYGPIGNLIRINIINFWRQEFVRKNNFSEIFGSIILPKDVFQASGHLGNFDDPIATCEKCKQVYRLDRLISEITEKEVPENMEISGYQKLITDNNIVCSKCKGQLTDIKRFNLMSSINVGAQSGNLGYLRGETCQSIFLDFSRVYKTGRQTLPITISQHGTVYRNEISPRNGLLRCREFEQLETEMFFDADKIDTTPIPLEPLGKYKIRFKLLKDKEEKDYNISKITEKKITTGNLITYALYITQKFLEDIGFSHDNIRFRELPDNDRAFYSKQTFDCEVRTEKEWVELFCVNYRTDYDLLAHGKGSKKDLSVSEEGKRIQPHVLEICSIGLGRLFYVLLENSFETKTINEEERNFLHLKPKLSPYFVSILPLMKKDGLSEKATEIYATLLKENKIYQIFYDEAGSIGKRYARLDEIGCNYCLTVDHETLEKQTVTIRDRDSQEQKRISIKSLSKILDKLYYQEKKFNKL
jgi:glycyl-tRNA synthetase